LLCIVNIHPVYPVVKCITWGNVCLFDLAVYYIPIARVKLPWCWSQERSKHFGK